MLNIELFEHACWLAFDAGSCKHGLSLWEWELLLLAEDSSELDPALCLSEWTCGGC